VNYSWFNILKIYTFIAIDELVQKEQNVSTFYVHFEVLTRFSNFEIPNGRFTHPPISILLDYFYIYKSPNREVFYIICIVSTLYDHNFHLLLRI